MPCPSGKNRSDAGSYQSQQREGTLNPFLDVFHSHTQSTLFSTGEIKNPFHILLLYYIHAMKGFSSGIEYVSLNVTGIHPLRKALVSALFYIFFCLLYIWISGLVANKISPTKHELVLVEMYKGFIFVTLSGGLIFVLSYLRWKHEETHQVELLQQEQALIRADRKEVAAASMASMCHDLNNLLTAQFALIEEMNTDDMTIEELRELCSDIRPSMIDLRNMVQRLQKSLTDTDEEEWERIDFSEHIHQTYKFIRKHPSFLNIQLETDLDPTLESKVNVGMFHSMLHNLMINAAQAMDGRGILKVTVSRSDHQCTLLVHDTGPGIPKDLKEKVQKPLFTTKPDGNGLGLISVKAFALAHEGEMLIEDSVLGGAAVGCRFSLSEKPLAKST